MVVDHTVTVSSAPSKDDQPTPVKESGGTAFRSVTVPRTFSERSDEDNQIDIELTSDDIARYARRDK